MTLHQYGMYLNLNTKNNGILYNCFMHKYTQNQKLDLKSSHTAVSKWKYPPSPVGYSVNDGIVEFANSDEVFEAVI